MRILGYRRPRNIDERRRRMADGDHPLPLRFRRVVHSTQVQVGGWS